MSQDMESYRMKSSERTGAGVTERSNSQELPEGGNIDKIRDILFGAQSRDFDKRMARIEERLNKETVAVRDEMRQRFDALEAYIKTEFEALAQRVKSEQDERADNVRDVTRDLRETAKGIEKKLGQLDESTTRSQRDLRQQILDQSKTLADDIRQKYEAMATLVAQHVDKLQNDKTDRSALADLFTEMAVRLNNDFKLPGQV